jgi:hypothetical protein
VEISAVVEHVPGRVDMREFKCASCFAQQDVGCKRAGAGSVIKFHVLSFSSEVLTLLVAAG